jgi:hypothetical protein
MRVDIYRNLNRAKQGLPEQWSIRHKGLVIGYTSAAILENATTYVVPGAVDKIRAKGVKQVCAWFTGEWTPTRILRTERHRKKDIPIYAAPLGVPVIAGDITGKCFYAAPLIAGDITGKRSFVTFNPRHKDYRVAQRFYTVAHQRPITNRADGLYRGGSPDGVHCDRFRVACFCLNHKVWVSWCQC